MPGRFSVLPGTGLSHPEKRLLVSSAANGIRLGHHHLIAVYLYEVYLSCMAIQSFADKAVETFFLDSRPPPRAGWANVAKVALRKLDLVDYADKLGDLASPPGHRLKR